MSNLGTSLGLLFQSIFHGLAQCAQTLNKVFSAAFGGIAALCDLYNLSRAFYEENHNHRKTAVLTHGGNFLLNSFYTVGAILRFISLTLLNIAALAIDLLSLSRASFLTHKARQAVKEAEHTGSNVDHLNSLRETSFQCKADTAYTVISAISTSVFIAGCFFPPILLPALVGFVLFKIVQFIDYVSDLKLSRWLSGNKKPVPSAVKAPAVPSSGPAPTLGQLHQAVNAVPPGNQPPVPAVVVASAAAVAATATVVATAAVTATVAAANAQAIANEGTPARTLSARAS